MREEKPDRLQGSLLPLSSLREAGPCPFSPLWVSIYASAASLTLDFTDSAVASSLVIITFVPQSIG